MSVIADKHKKDNDLQGDEFLSGFAKDDKLRPVITLTVYFGMKEWDGPRKLSDMFQDIHQEVIPYVDEHKLNLIIPKEISDFGKFCCFI